MTNLGYASVQIIPSFRGISSQLGKGMGGAGGAAGDMFNKSFGSRVTGALKTVGKVAAAAVAVTAAVGLKRLGSASIDAAKNLQNTQLTLKGLYGSAEIADTTIGMLRKTAAASPIDFKAFQDGATSLAYMGFQGKEVDQILGNVSKAIVTAGGSSEDMGRVTNAMLQMQNSGKVYAAQLNQISAAGVPIFSGLAAHFGTNVANVREMVTEGKVSIDDVMSVMQNATGDTFQKMLAASDETSKSFSNQWARAKDNIVTAIAVELLGVLDRLAPLMGRIADEAPKAIERGVSAIATGGKKANEFFSNLAGSVRNLKDRLLGVPVSMEALNTASAAGIPIFSGLAAKMGTSLGAVRSLGTDGKVSVGDLAGSFGDVRQAAADAGTTFGEVAQKLSPDAVRVAESIWGSLKRTWDGIKDPLLTIAGSLGELAGTFAKVSASMGISYWQLLAFALDQAAKILAVALPIALNVVAGILERVAGWVARNEWAVKAMVLAWTAFKVGSLIFSLAAMGKAMVTKTIATIAATKAAVAHRAGMIALGTVYVAQRAANLASAAALGIKTIALKAATVATKLFNAALRMNPIGLVITALLLLGAGLVATYKKSETFRNIVDKAFSIVKAGAEAVGRAAVWLWEKAIKPAFNFIAIAAKVVYVVIATYVSLWIAYFRLLGRIAMWLWNNAIKPAFKAIGDFAGWLWNKAIRPAISAIGDIFQWLWRNIVKRYIAFIVGYLKLLAAIAKWLWNNAIKPAINAIGDIFRWLWKNVVQPVFRFIGNAIQGAWRNVIRPAFRFLREGVDKVGDVFRWLRDKVIRPVWDWISDKISKGWRNGIRPVFEKIKEGLRKVRDVFRNIRDKVGEIWAKIANKVRRPINWVIEHVINGGIVQTFNDIADGVGLPKSVRLPEMDTLPRFARGGVVPGGFSPVDNQLIAARSGEAVMIPEFTTAIGGAAGVRRMNDAARRGLLRNHIEGFARGGVVKPVGNARVSQGWSPQHGGIDYAAPLGTLIRAAKAGVVSFLARWGYSYGKHVRVNHGGGVETLYAHMSSIARKIGDRVVAGTGLGRVGSTGNSTGNHLHFEVRSGGRRINPAGFLSGAEVVGDGGGGGVFDFIKDSFRHFKSAGSWLKDKAQAAFDFVGNAGGVLRKFIGGKINNLLGGMAGGDNLMVKLAKRFPRHILDKIVEAGKSLAAKVPDSIFGGAPGSTDGSAAQQYAQAQLTRFGWGRGQWAPLRQLWEKESNWRWDAKNPSSGAYGIPQALPASKMASAGADWRTNPETQIRWGMGYIKNRPAYGSPMKAWEFWKRNNWYDQGGMWPNNTFGINRSGGPEAVFNEAQWRTMRRAVQPALDTASGSGHGRGVNVEHLEVQAYSDKFRLRDLEMELAMHGVS